VIGPNAVSICESNSLRQAIEPGLFLMVRSCDLKIWKSSARQVKKYADRIVISNGSGFDFDIDQIKLVDGKWALLGAIKGNKDPLGSLEKATAIIMAGGGSRRMGTDKSMLLIEGRPIIENIYEQLRDCFEQILISANDVDKFAFLGLDVIPDKIPEQGPLMGIASALEASANELNFVVACDIPHINLECVRTMVTEAVKSKADIVVPKTDNQKYEPLFAIYRKSSLEAINKVLSSKGRKISDVFVLCKVKYVELGASLVNLNTMAEFEEFQKKLI
ncbi:MAG: molybdenum cofactor guanylyltransferase, partial [Planctomycetota bacterium]